ncbi:NADH dehydrogenase [ubiquinone] iron-sulfur protein 5 [Mactra antiquata]
MVFEKFKVVLPNHSPYVNYLYSGNTKCTHMEKDWMMCAERVGMSNTPTVCKEFLDDYRECVYGIRHYERSLALKKAKAEKNIEPPGIPPQYQ